jgi:hypothetical protein
VQLDTPLENFWAMVETITGTPYDERTREYPKLECLR